MYNCINKSGWSFRGNGLKKMHKENKTGRPEGGLIVSCVIFRLTAMVGHGTTGKWFFRIKDGVNPGRLGHYPWD